MRQLEKTLWYFLSHSAITLFAILLLFAVLLPIQVILPGKSGDPDRIHTFLIINNLVLSSFVGIYLGGALLKLKQFYLWSINAVYRRTLIGSFLFLTSLFSIMQSAVMAVHLPDTSLPLLMLPICAAVFASFTVLGKTLAHKILIPGVLFLIGQLHHLGVDWLVIMIIAVFATAALVYYLYTGDVHQIKQSKEALLEVGVTSTYIAAPLVMKANHLIGKLFIRIVSRSKKDIGWAVSLPYFKLSLIPFLYVFFIIPPVLLLDKKVVILEIFTVMMMASALMSIVMEARNLLPQTKNIAHLFVGDRHQQLKKQIMRTVDKTIALNCITLVSLVLLGSFVLSMEIMPRLLLIQTLVVIGVGLALYPAMLCLKWLSVSLLLVLALSLYFGLIFLASTWIDAYEVESWWSYKSTLFISALIILRIISQRMFENIPMEKLMVIK